VAGLTSKLANSVHTFQARFLAALAFAG